MSPQWGPVTDVLGWTLLHFVWQGTLAALALSAVLSLLPRRWAAVRYVLACVTLAVMALLPIATALTLAGRPTGPLGLAGMAPGAQLSSTRPDASRRQDLASAELGTTARQPDAQSASLGTPAAVVAPLATWFPWLTGFWLAGVCLCSIRLAGGWWQARRLIREDAFEPDEAWVQAVGRLATCLALRTPVRLRESARVQVPVVVGALKPVLLLPAATLSGLSPQQIEAVLAHELAHIRRHDYLVNLLQSIVETVLFYHPGVWWVSHTIRVEREHCCDDLAVAACGDPLLYARALTTIETLRHERVGMAMAVSSGSLLSRVRRLLGVRPPTRLATSGWAVLSLTIVMVAAAGVTGWLGSAVKQVPALAQSADVPSAPAHAPASVPPAAMTTQPNQPTSPVGAPVPSGDTGDPADAHPDLELAMREVETSIASAVAEAEHHIERELREMDERSGSHVALEAIGEEVARVVGQVVEHHRGEMEGHARELADTARRELDAQRGEIERHARELAREAMSLQRDALREHRAHLKRFHEEQARAIRERARVMADHARALAAQACALAAESRRLAHDGPAENGQRPPEPPQPPEPPVSPGPSQTLPAPPAPPVPPVPPAPPALPVPPAPPRGAMSMGQKGRSWSMVRTENGKTLKVQGKGRVEFTDDDTDVKSLEPGGSFSIETAGGWFPSSTTSWFEVTAAKDGSQSRTYRIDGKAVSEAEGRKWLASVLPEVVRELASGAEVPVARIPELRPGHLPRLPRLAWRSSADDTPSSRTIPVSVTVRLTPPGAVE